MACGCTKTQPSQTEKYVYTDPQGKVTANLSATQARAMQIRKGGGNYTVQR